MSKPTSSRPQKLPKHQPRIFWQLLTDAGKSEPARLALCLESVGCTHVVGTYRNPVPGVMPESQYALRTEYPNHLLHEAISDRQAVLKVAALFRVFDEQIRFAESDPTSQTSLLESRPVLPDDLQEFGGLLDSSFGWLIWDWQLDAWLIACGWDAATAVELRSLWNSRRRLPSLFELTKLRGGQSLRSNLLHVTLPSFATRPIEAWAIHQVIPSMRVAKN